MLAVVGCSSLRAGQNYGARSAIDTEGRSLSDTTALGDIDMAETTVGDLKGIVAPNYSIVSNAAMDASRKIPEIEDVLYNNTIGYGEASNIIWQATIAATTNVVHGDYADADRAAFPNGLGLKAGDGTDKGYVGLRLRSFESHGLEVVGTRVTSATAAPYTLFRLTDAGIGFPKAGLGDTVQSSDFTFLYWDAFSRATHVQDYMPSSGTANYEGYPISGKAFNEYFWGLGDLPAKAKASVTVHAASNLVGTTGAPMGVSDIIGSAVKESVLAVTSDVPVYAYSSAWTSDWPIDDSAQPSQPQWADGTWSVYLVEGGQTLPGVYSVEGTEDATTLTIDIAGFPTVFTRESTVSGYVNVHGLARLSDIAAHTNRTDNPHRVTAAQVGAYTKEETDGAIFAAQKYIYDNTTETLYRFSAENDFLMMKAVTNVPPTPAVIRALEEMR